MFEYVKVDLIKVSTEQIDNFPSEAVTVIAKLSESVDEADEIYFKIAPISVNIANNKTVYSGHYEGIFPSGALNEGYLYLVYSKHKEIKPIFIDPYIYEGIDRERLDEIVSDYIEHGISGIASYELTYADDYDDYDYDYEISDEYLENAEIKLDLELKSRLLAEVYLESHEFYELKDTEELITGPMYIEFISEEDIGDNGDLIYYYEPLVYIVSQEEMILVSEQGLKDSYVSLFLMNDDFTVERKKYLLADEIVDYLRDNDYSVRSISVGAEIEREIRMINELKF